MAPLSGKVTYVIESNYYQRGDTDICDGIVVWGERVGDYNIRGYDHNTETYFDIPSSGDEIQPTVSGSLIVFSYEKTQNSIYHLYGYDLDNPGVGVFPIDTYNSWHGIPDMHGDILVWQDNRNGNADIYYMNMADASPSPVRVTTSSGADQSPAVWGSTIVWQNGSGDIYRYNINTGITTAVCTATETQRDPYVYDNYILWTDWRSGTPYTYYYDLDNPGANGTQLTTVRSWEPAMYGSIAVWSQSGTTTSTDVYGIDFDDLASGAFPIANSNYQDVVPEIWGPLVAWFESSSSGTSQKVMLADLDAVPDTTGPSTSSVRVYPAFTRNGPVDVSATIDDSASGDAEIEEAEYFIDAVGATGTGTALAADDGAFDESVEQVTATIAVAGLDPGVHTMYVRGKDENGNWGAVSARNFYIMPPMVPISITTILGGNLSHASQFMGMLGSELPCIISEPVAAHLDLAQSYIELASSLSNPIAANGALSKAMAALQDAYMSIE